jgi:hypothetical protein
MECVVAVADADDSRAEFGVALAVAQQRGGNMWLICSSAA